MLLRNDRQSHPLYSYPPPRCPRCGIPMIQQGRGRAWCYRCERPTLLATLEGGAR